MNSPASRNPLARYAHWLHTMGPAGGVVRLPAADADGATNVPGLSIVGDLTGVPLLKLSANAGVLAVRRVADELKSEGGGPADDALDLAIVGGGTSGFAAGLEARKLGLRYAVFEAAEPFSTIANFPKAKPIYAYPTEARIEGDLELHAKSKVKEGLLDDLREQTVDAGVTWVVGHVEKVERRGGLLEVVVPDGVRAPDGASLNGTGFVVGRDRIKARRVIVGIGRSGNYRTLGVPGEGSGKVMNRLHDPADHAGQDVLVVGGGDSALEAAIALVGAGANVTLSYRGKEFNRPKPENQEQIAALAGGASRGVEVERPADRQSTAVGAWTDDAGTAGRLELLLGSTVKAIRDDSVDVETDGGESRTLRNDAVFALIGREPPLDFFRKSGVTVRGDKTAGWWASLIGFVAFCFWLYHWKSGQPLFGLSNEAFGVADWHLPAWLNPTPASWIAPLPSTLGAWAADPANPAGVLLDSAKRPSFYYTLVYSAVIIVFGIKRIRYRKTPYVKWQTLTLMSIQVGPLFLLPEFVLPWLNGLGFFDDTSAGRWLERTLFPGDSWWRAYGLILAWPLFIYNWFTATPIWGWLVLGAVQTFVLIPGMIYFWGKGAYCGWICSCGALAETLGDRHREKMPHGPGWNRLNMLGQGILGFAAGLMVLRIMGWSGVGWAAAAFEWGEGRAAFVNYRWFVDILLAGVLGYGLYFWYSGRMWCRFACPLAALMHVYARFSRFRILADKKKCISCNVCTSVCHQGIDVMSFANKGRPMADPQCVRCSACVQQCPTGVLSFGQVDRRTGEVISQDPSWLAASPVRMREVHQVTVNGKSLN